MFLKEIMVFNRDIKCIVMIYFLRDNAHAHMHARDMTQRYFLLLYYLLYYFLSYSLLSIPAP
jgi:hypothetical protein